MRDISAFSAISTPDQGGHEAVDLETDLVVFDRNLFEVPVTQVNEAQVEMTLLDGKVVYERNE